MRPNFAFLMAADARRAAHAVPGVRGVTVALEDHYTGDEINAARSAAARASPVRSPARPTTTTSRPSASCSRARR